MAVYKRKRAGVQSSPEKVVQKSILDELEKRGCTAFKIISGNRNGIPDILACVKGRFVAFEVKKFGCENILSEIQRRKIEEIRRSGGVAEVVSSLKDVESILLSLKNSPDE